ncbi:MAG: alpha-glucan family phosphorylase [Candidatus Omnitrophica bacterium]|nr:alpha-glucan family phosphorylase [Candidatus Omnitrophota bacterium]
MQRTRTSEFLSLVEVENYEDIYSKDIQDGLYFGMPLECVIETEKRLRSSPERSIAYFSMEYGLGSSFYNSFKTARGIHPNNSNQEHEVFSNFRLADYFFTFQIESIMDLPLYSGGLGVLAGDTLKTMADYKLPVVALGMLWNTGYFRQRFWFKYGQMPEAIHWDPASYPGLIPLKNRVKIKLKSETIELKLWKYYCYSYRHDYAIPLILLDSCLESNTEKLKCLTDQLYRSDDVWIKIMQRVILGMGGVAALEELGYNIGTYHMNEGHAVFAFLAKARGLGDKDIEGLKQHFAYTCHTPVEAGHDRFSTGDLGRILPKEDMEIAQEFGREGEGAVNLTLLAMNVSSRINAVSKAHQKVTHLQFPAYRDTIGFVTNGVHTHTWISDSFMQLFEDFRDTFGDIKANPMALAKASDLRKEPGFREALWQAHQVNKSRLCGMLYKWGLNKDLFTICWARRVAAYKRPSMILQDVNRLLEIAGKYGPIQIIFAGKAHPMDNMGFTYINEMLDKVDGLNEEYDMLKIIMLENYETFLAKTLTSGVDVWLNNPLPPFEASGTSGMKAILNGVIQMTTLDGWVVEAEDKGIGKIFGYRNKEGHIGGEHNLHMEDDARQLYKALEETVALYYRTNAQGKVDASSPWIDMMINCIAAGADFNTYRMLDEYKEKIWQIK